MPCNQRKPPVICMKRALVHVVRVATHMYCVFKVGTCRTITATSSVVVHYSLVLVLHGLYFIVYTHGICYIPGLHAILKFFCIFWYSLYGDHPGHFGYPPRTRER